MFQITAKILWFFQVDFFKFHDFSSVLGLFPNSMIFPGLEKVFFHFPGFHDFSRGWKPWLLLIPVMLGRGPLEVCGFAASIADRDSPGNFILSDTVPPSPLPPRLKSNKFTLSEPCHAKFSFRTPAFAVPSTGANYERLLPSLWKCVAKVWKKSTCPPLFTFLPLFLPVLVRGTVSNFHPLFPPLFTSYSRYHTKRIAGNSSLPLGTFIMIWLTPILYSKNNIINLTALKTVARGVF